MVHLLDYFLEAVQEHKVDIVLLVVPAELVHYYNLVLEEFHYFVHYNQEVYNLHRVNFVPHFLLVLDYLYFLHLVDTQELDLYYYIHYFHFLHIDN